MAKTGDLNDPASINAYINKLEAPMAALVEAIRQVILNTDPIIGEQIKWNSPSFFYQGTMQPFNPKEYKRDMVVMHLHKKAYVLLVFPTGATINDTSGILEGNYEDGRRMVTIKSVEELNHKKELLQSAIRAWLKLVDK